MLTAPISIRLSRTNRRLIRAAARRMGRTTSDLIRRAALALADQVLAQEPATADDPPREPQS